MSENRIAIEEHITGGWFIIKEVDEDNVRARLRPWPSVKLGKTLMVDDMMKLINKDKNYWVQQYLNDIEFIMEMK